MKVLKSPEWRITLTLVGCSLFVAAAMAANPEMPKRVRSVPGLVQYQTPAGEQFAALVLPATTAPSVKSGPHDHVLIVDTSASQTGHYRSRTLSIASAYAAALPAEDRMLLLASDVTADDLTSGFAAPKSAELAAGLDRLNERIPLGCSNLELALRAAVKSFQGNRSRSLLIVGDGFSTAQLIQFPTMKKLINELRDGAIPVSSFAVGPRIDLVLLGTLAQHTGGVVTVDEAKVVAENGNSGTDTARIGRELIEASRSPVFYPSAMITKPEMIINHSMKLPPVRFDRETVLLGRGFNGKSINVRLSGTLVGQAKEYSWNLDAEKLNGSTAFILHAWKMAEATQGLALPFAGRSLLITSYDEYQGQLADLADAGSVQLQRKNLDQAEQFAQSLEQLDPGSSKARRILATSKSLRTLPVKNQRTRLLAQADSKEEPAPEEKTETEEKTAPEESPAASEEKAPTEEAPSTEEKAPVEETPATEEKVRTEEKAAGDEKPAVEEKTTTEEQPATTEEKPAEEKPATEPAPAEETAPAAVEPIPSESALDSNDRSNPKPGTLLEELTTRQRVRIQELTDEVNRVVADSMALAKTNFQDAISILKDQQNSIASALEIPDSIRLPLRRKVETTLQKLENENETYVQRAAALRTKQSQLESRKKLMDQAERDEERMQQLIERVRALITRGVRGEAEAFEEAEEYSRIAVELDPYASVPNLDVFNSESFGALDKARRMRALRADKFLAELYEVERAHVPFPDEPPILWPSAERWREITIKREKWKSVDLKNYSKQEEKIVSALNKPMKEKFDFVDATLDDVKNKLQEVYEINVIIDKLKLEEEAIASDQADITLSIGDITLKNALKLLLEPKALTYAIQDEVLLITTKTTGGAKMPIKAYYAGDLAIPVNPYAGMGGGAGGSMGGMGGGMGGMGGGMGGMGGGMGGMGGGMGGMGGGMGGMGGGMGGGVFNIPPFHPERVSPASEAVAPGPQPDSAVLPNSQGDDVPTDDQFGLVETVHVQAFAQVKDQGGALNSDALRARKKKQLSQQ